MPAEPLPRFVWVDTTNRWTNPYPGLLLGRRLVSVPGHGSKWKGLVVYAYDAGSAAHGASLTVTSSWVDMAHMRPANASRPGLDLGGYSPVNADRLN